MTVIINIYVHYLIYREVDTFIIFILQIRRPSPKEIACPRLQIKEFSP